MQVLNAQVKGGCVKESKFAITFDKMLFNFII